MKRIESNGKGSYILGRVALRSTKSFTQHYECAAWHKTVECPPQVVELRFTLHGDGGYPSFYATFAGKVTSSNFVPLFGGVRCGSGGIDEEVGKDATHTVCFEAQHHLAGSVLNRSDFTYSFDLDLDLVSIEWTVWKSAGYLPDDILYREGEPWHNLATTNLKAMITPHDPKLIEALRYSAEATLRDHPEAIPGEFTRYWEHRRDYMAALLTRLPKEDAK
jgi:hypothetical protein